MLEFLNNLWELGGVKEKGCCTGPPEPVFVLVYGAQESIPRNRFSQPMWLGGTVRKIGLSYWPARLGIDSCATQMVYKYGLRLHSLAELVPWNQFLGSLIV
jgi:hypothetical protein